MVRADPVQAATWHPYWVSRTPILKSVRKWERENLPVLVLWKKQSPRHGVKMVREKKNFCSHHFSPMSGTLFFRTLKLASSLSLTYRHFSGPGFWILTKGVKRQPVRGQPCQNSIKVFGMEQPNIYIYIYVPFDVKFSEASHWPS